MNNVSKINIKVGEISLLLEGDEEFIDEYSESIDHLLSKIKDYNSHKNNGSNAINTNKGHNIPKKNSGSLGDFILKFDSGKPSDNALLLAAYSFSQLGNEPFSFEEIKEMADEAGIVLPDRVDMTFKSAQRDGKSLFTNAGRGKVKPTIHGQQYFIDEYDVNKGTKQKNQNE